MIIKPKPMIIAAFSVIVVFIMGYGAFAGIDDEPGSSKDPLVSQSYVDQYTQWQVAELKTGQVLRCHAGTEFIPRRGRAVIVDSTSNGIPDVTGGVDVYANSEAPLNHLMIVPRDDGRGIMAQSPIVVLYRGQVTVQ